MSGGLHNLMMLDHIQDKLQMSRNHLDHYRRKGLDMPTDDAGGKADDMKILSTGDVHLTTASPQSHPQPQPSGMGKLLAGAALGASLIGIPGAGVAGYLASQYLQKPAAEVQPPAESEKVNLGLLRVEDLQGAE